MSPSTLIMTATIQPPLNAPELQRCDPELRLEDYLKSLDFYLDIDKKYIDKIIFAENSGSDLSRLKQLVQKKANKQVEFISFVSQCDPLLGKGYSELNILDKATTESELIMENDFIWKVTGRLRVINLEKIIANAPANYDCYCDLRNLPVHFLKLVKDGWVWNGFRWMDTRIFSCSVKGYKKYILNKNEQMTKPYNHPLGNSYMIENFLFEIFYQAYKDGDNIVPRFKVQPIIEGVRGQSNRSYQTFQDICKMNLRRVSRKVLPFVWC